MNPSPMGRSREQSYFRIKKESFFMQSQRSSSRIGAILSLLGGALAIYAVFFLPMVFGSGGGSFTPTSEWTVMNFFFQYISPLTAVFLALLLLSALFILVTSAASFFQRLSPRIVTWRRIAAITALVIQGPVGLVGGFIYAFGVNFGAGYWLALLGCVVMVVGTFLN
jgi:hypothetical protein